MGRLQGGTSLLAWAAHPRTRPPGLAPVSVRCPLLRDDSPEILSFSVRLRCAVLACPFSLPQCGRGENEEGIGADRWQDELAATGTDQNSHAHKNRGDAVPGRFARGCERREIPLFAGRPIRRKRMGKKKSACSVRNDGRGLGEDVFRWRSFFGSGFRRGKFLRREVLVEGG